jgi:hypothetical protein
MKSAERAPLLMTSLRVNFMYPWLMWPWRDRMTGFGPMARFFGPMAGPTALSD